MRRLRAGLVVAAALALLLAAVAARAEVRVVEEEVVFSIRAPRATSVFLVGDFNNWNPTIEKMDKVDDRFEVRLFLLPGTYRYKFVVDGASIPDPDNPSADPSKGSPLQLQERSGMLVLGAAEEGEKKTKEKLVPALRYSGAFFIDDGEWDSDQALDVWLSHRGETFDAQVDFKTIEESWDASPPRAEVLFDRGHIDLGLGSGVLKGFENDSTWASNDPFHLFGSVGVYGYDAGFERRGVSVETPLVLKTTLRAVFSDYIGDRPGAPPSFESDALEDFAASDSPDTALYRYGDTYEDEDTWGFDLAADAGSLGLGYARRWNRGFHPGSLAEVAKRGSSFDVAFSSTREFWDADSWYLRWGFLERLGARIGFGRAAAEIRTDSRSFSTFEEPGELSIGQTTEAYRSAIPLQTSTRWQGGLDFSSGAWRSEAGYSWAEYEFESGVYASSTARVRAITLDASYDGGKWRADALLRHVDQDYGETPVDFHAATPRRNFWLDHRDLLSTADMVSFDLERAMHVRAVFEWGERTLSNVRAERKPGATAVLAEAGVTTREIFEAVEYAYLRLALERAFRRGVFVQWDSRVARYDKVSWGLEDSYFSTYLECGYRNRWAEVSVGFGLDPVILDPVVNDYADIGREEYLRRAIPADLTREGYGVLGENLRRQEERLEDARTVKLEVILSF